MEKQTSDNAGVYAQQPRWSAQSVIWGCSRQLSRCRFRRGLVYQDRRLNPACATCDELESIGAEKGNFHVYGWASGPWELRTVQQQGVQLSRPLSHNPSNAEKGVVERTGKIGPPILDLQSQTEARHQDDSVLRNLLEDG